jgi:PAS domain S-box-containing protein
LSQYEIFGNYRQLFELFPDPVILGELNGKILHANHAAEKLFGYREEAMADLSILDFLSEEAPGKLPEILKDELHDGGFKLEIPVRFKNESIIPCEIQTTLLKQDDRTLRCMVIHDLSGREKAKEESGLIADDRENLSSLIPIIFEEPEMIFELNRSGNIVSINNLCAEKTGYTPNDLKKKHFSEILASEDRSRASIDFARLMRGEKLDAFEYTMVTKDGVSLPVIVSLSKVLSNGKIQGVRGVALDISEHKRVEKELIVKEKLNALGEMASGVVHNINNILAIILGYLELFPMSGMDETCRSILLNIKRAALDGTEIIKRINNFSHISAEPSQELYNLNAIILDVLEFFKPRYSSPELGISVITRLGDIPSVRVTPYEMREVLSNIIINALDAMPNGGFLTVNSFLSGNHIVVEVEDSGIGMSEETKKHLFEPFYTTKKMWGTGIGMSVSHDIMKKLGGDLLVESEERTGTRISILLPLPKREPIMRLSEVPEDGAQKTYSILVIDDEENICEILMEYLKRDGYDVATALSGLEGMALFRERYFGTVITDLNIPDLSGWEIAKQMRKERPNTFIIMLTGWETRMDDMNNLEKNVDMVLHKPIDFSKLSGIVRDACSKPDNRIA